ncbi:MAG: hypothetical protein KTR32_11395 [Granulosicoccus sp.]|nr:hypothetical protein [Granulosicoccus sp.]
MHSTNYYDTLIEVAEDCKAGGGVTPVEKSGKKTVACLEYEIISDHPYRYTSDDVIFQVYALRNNIAPTEMKAEKQRYFSKGRPCFRASPLPKSYGWGIHSDKVGKIALVAIGSPRYDELCRDTSVAKKKAMRSKKV